MFLWESRHGATYPEESLGRSFFFENVSSLSIWHSSFRTFLRFPVGNFQMPNIFMSSSPIGFLIAGCFQIIEVRNPDRFNQRKFNQRNYEQTSSNFAVQTLNVRNRILAQFCWRLFNKEQSTRENFNSRFPKFHYQRPGSASSDDWPSIDHRIVLIEKSNLHTNLIQTLKIKFFLCECWWSRLSTRSHHLDDLDNFTSDFVLRSSKALMVTSNRSLL